MLQQLAGGMLVSIEIFFVTLLFSLPLGLLICFGRMSRKKVIRRIVSAEIYFINITKNCQEKSPCFHKVPAADVTAHQQYFLKMFL